jgi:hypothetical protein
MEGLFLAQMSKITKSHTVGREELLLMVCEQNPVFMR